MKRFLMLVMTIALSGCGNGYFFETKSIYQAVASNLKVDLTARGHVFDGDDLTDHGLTTGIISSLKFSDTIYFQTNVTKFISLRYKSNKINNITSFATSLAYCLDQIGYSEYNKKELVELGKVIQSTAYGPKGTYVEGQTDLIKVISVNFETNRGNQITNE